MTGVSINFIVPGKHEHFSLVHKKMGKNPKELGRKEEGNVTYHLSWSLGTHSSFASTLPLVSLIKYPETVKPWAKSFCLAHLYMRSKVS